MLRVYRKVGLSPGDIRSAEIWEDAARNRQKPPVCLCKCAKLRLISERGALTSGSTVGHVGLALGNVLETGNAAVIPAPPERRCGSTVLSVEVQEEKMALWIR